MEGTPTDNYDWILIRFSDIKQKTAARNAYDTTKEFCYCDENNLDKFHVWRTASTVFHTSISIFTYNTVSRTDNNAVIQMMKTTVMYSLFRERPKNPCIWIQRIRQTSPWNIPRHPKHVPNVFTSSFLAAYFFRDLLKDIKWSHNVLI